MEAISPGSGLTVSVDARTTAYALVTAAHNEAAYIERTIRSVLKQVILPTVWVIVSDASTDRTEEIVAEYAAKHSFIRLLRREKDEYRGFASKVFALRAGSAQVPWQTGQLFGHLDADVELEAVYFRDLLERFDRDPRLGIAGGWYFELAGGEYRPAMGSSTASIPGGVQMFRRECFDQIGGLLPIEYGGEDWCAEIMARKAGWRVQSFPDLPVRHLRPAGSRGSRIRYCYRQGRADFCLGTHPLFEIVKACRRSVWPPFVLGAIARLCGFLMGTMSGRRVVPADCVAFLQNEQLARLGLIGQK